MIRFARLQSPALGFGARRQRATAREMLNQLRYVTESPLLEVGNRILKPDQSF